MGGVAIENETIVDGRRLALIVNRNRPILGVKHVITPQTMRVEIANRVRG